MPGYHEKFPIHQNIAGQVIEFDWDIAVVKISLESGILYFEEIYPLTDPEKVINDFSGWATHMERLSVFFNGGNLPDIAELVSKWQVYMEEAINSQQ